MHPGREALVEHAEEVMYPELSQQAVALALDFEQSNWSMLSTGLQVSQFCQAVFNQFPHPKSLPFMQAPIYFCTVLEIESKKATTGRRSICAETTKPTL
nr:hypothetical protein CFP56_14580 [Quercus suber]